LGIFCRRHKAILCQTETYLSELVRYIHLNPVRAKIVRKPEHYRYSSHRCYLGLQEAGIVDVDPVLRHFGGKKKLARERYREFVAAGMKLGHREEFYLTDAGRILGTEEFVDATIHRIGETRPAGKPGRHREVRELPTLEVERLLTTVEKICQLRREEFCGPGKSAATVMAKEALILVGHKAGGSMKLMSEITGMSSSTVSRRHVSACGKMRRQGEMSKLVDKIESQYWGCSD